MSEGTGVTLKEILGWKKSGSVGLELEVESSEPLPIIEVPPWKTKDDESLRGQQHGGAKEYVTDGAIPCDSTKTKAIEYLCGELAKNKGIDHNSPRTSVHVHINVLDCTPLQIWTAVCTYWLIENLLLEYCGEDRKGNCFCLRLKDAEGLLTAVENDIIGRDVLPFDTINSDTCRYSAQNIAAIRKFGSLEYRGMRGTINPAIIDLWSSSMYSIVHRSKRFSSPEEMLDRYIEMKDTRTFLEWILPRDMVDILVTYNNWERLVKDNAGLVAEIAYLTDWKKWKKLVDETASRIGILGRTMFNEPPRPRQQVPPPRWGFVDGGVNVLLNTNPSPAIPRG